MISLFLLHGVEAEESAGGGLFLKERFVVSGNVVVDTGTVAKGISLVLTLLLSITFKLTAGVCPQVVKVN